MTAPREIGDRVRLSSAHCRNTGQFTGDEPPTAFGPFARGSIIDFVQLGPETKLATIRFDDGTQRNVHVGNLETCR
jgi:hypothetical protein